MSVRPSPPSTLWKALAITGAVVGLLLWFTSVFLEMHYAYSRPRVPDARTGRIYELNIHGSFIYLTRQEHLMLTALMVTAGVSFGAAVCIDIFKDVFPRR
jgi:hypothetical protein